MYTELLVPNIPEGMLDWLKENFEGKFTVKPNRIRRRYGGCCPGPQRTNPSSDYIQRGYKICFGSEENALAFKLVWGEHVNDNTIGGQG